MKRIALVLLVPVAALADCPEPSSVTEWRISGENTQTLIREFCKHEKVIDLAWKYKMVTNDVVRCLGLMEQIEDELKSRGHPMVTCYGVN